MRIIVLFPTILFFFANPAESIEISNFKSGLACTDGETFAWICHEVEDIYVTGQGKCVVDHEQETCTWYGISFEYKNAVPGSKIECRNMQSDYPERPGTRGIRENAAFLEDFSLVIDRESDLIQYLAYFTWPQPTRGRANFESDIVTTYTSCYLDNQLLFEYNFNFHIPLVVD